MQWVPLALMTHSACFVLAVPPAEIGGSVGTAAMSDTQIELDATPSNPPTQGPSQEGAWDAWGAISAGQLWVTDAPRAWDVGLGYHVRGIANRIPHGPFAQLRWSPYTRMLSSRDAMQVSLTSRTQAVIRPRSGVRQSATISLDFLRTLPDWGYVESNDKPSVSFHTPGQLGFGLYLEGDYSHFTGPRGVSLDNYWTISAGVTFRFPVVGVFGIFLPD